MLAMCALANGRLSSGECGGGLLEHGGGSTVKAFDPFPNFES
jgi:hypothetical protein